MRTVYRSRTHGAFLRLFECRVRKIINCCHGKCGGSRPLPGVGWVEARDPRATAFRAQPPARTPTWAGRRRALLYGPRFATPGAGQIVKEQMHAPSIQAWLNCLQRSFLPYIYARISPPFARDANLRRKSNRSLHFRHLYIRWRRDQSGAAIQGRFARLPNNNSNCKRHRRPRAGRASVFDHYQPRQSPNFVAFRVLPARPRPGGTERRGNGSSSASPAPALFLWKFRHWKNGKSPCWLTPEQRERMQSPDFYQLLQTHVTRKYLARAATATAGGQQPHLAVGESHLALRPQTGGKPGDPAVRETSSADQSPLKRVFARLLTCVSP